ncbi:MAG: hypothetical protein WCI91_01480 [Candidatus Nomurabacteria bacterium]
MTTPELIEFIKNEFASGITQEVITNKLKTQGWSDSDVLEAFEVLNKKSFGDVIVNIDKPKEFPVQINQTILPVDNNVTTSSKSNSLKIVVSVFIIILLILGFFVAYASGIFLSPSKFFSQMIDSSKKNTSLSFDFNFTLDASNMKSFSSKIKPDSGISNISSFGMSGNLDLSNTENLNLNNSYSFKSGGVEANLDSRVTNGSLYFRLTKAPSLGFISLKPFENKWIVLPYKDKTGKIENNPVLSISPINPEIINNITDEQKKSLNDLVKNASFIKITKKHLPQIMNGKLVYHFDFDIDREGISTFIKGFTSYLKVIDKNNVVSQFDTSNFDKILSAIKEFKGEAWIGVFDKLPYKIIVNTDIYNPNDINDGYVKVSTTLNYSGWNKPVVVAVPTQSMTVEDLAKEAFGNAVTTDIPTLPVDNSMVSSNKVNSTSSSTISNKESITKVDNNIITDTKLSVDNSIKSIISSMRAQAEIFYNRDKNGYKGFCASKGNNGAYNLAITLPKGTIYKCKDSDKEWIATAKISNGEYFCADSTGFSSPLKSLPVDMICK